VQYPHTVIAVRSQAETSVMLRGFAFGQMLLEMARI
jgi:hypothetical protein